MNKFRYRQIERCYEKQIKPDILATYENEKRVKSYALYTAGRVGGIQSELWMAAEYLGLGNAEEKEPELRR